MMMERKPFKVLNTAELFRMMEKQQMPFMTKETKAEMDAKVEEFKKVIRDLILLSIRVYEEDPGHKKELLPTVGAIASFIIHGLTELQGILQSETVFVYVVDSVVEELKMGQGESK